jgi:anti-anti-sigma factor
MATAIERSPDRLVFDLAGVDFMDSSGIAVLLRARKAVVRSTSATHRQWCAA